MAVKLAAELIGAAARALEARSEERARRRAADRAYDTRRPHLWSGPIKTLNRETFCVYCKVVQTQTNEYALCPATGDPPR